MNYINQRKCIKLDQPKPISTMNALKAKLASNLAPSHTIAYSLTFLSYGCIITGLGPLVPYLAAQTGLAQTQYAYLFFWRSIGFLAGAFILRFLEQKLTFHAILFISSILMLIFQVAFCLDLDLAWQGFIIFLISILCCLLEVTINLSVLETQKNGDVQFWMLICHGIFGIGGLIGPILVYIFEIYSFAVMGLMVFLVTPCYYFLKTPQNHQLVEERASKEWSLEQLKNTGHQGPYPAAMEEKKQRKAIGKQIQILVSFMFLIYIALECSYGSWIASYTVLQGIATKQEATKYSSLFWVSITVFRFVSTCINLKSMKKLLMLSYGFVIFSTLTIALLLIGQKSLACMFSAIMFGMCYSSMFPLLFAIPTEYNLQITPGQGASFMIWAAMGEGVLSTMTGYLMGWFSNDMMFYSLFLSGSIFLICTHLLKGLYEKQSADFNVETEMKEVMIPKDK